MTKNKLKPVNKTAQAMYTLVKNKYSKLDNRGYSKLSSTDKIKYSVYVTLLNEMFDLFEMEDILVIDAILHT